MYRSQVWILPCQFRVMILFSSTFGSLLPKMLVLKSWLVKTESIQSNRNFYNKAKNKCVFSGPVKVECVSWPLLRVPVETWIIDVEVPGLTLTGQLRVMIVYRWTLITELCSFTEENWTINKRGPKFDKWWSSFDFYSSCVGLSGFLKLRHGLVCWPLLYKNTTAW